MAFQLRFAAEKKWRVFIFNRQAFNINLFPNQIFLNWSIEMKGRVVVTQSSNAAGKTIKKGGVPTKSKSSARGATSESKNTTVIKQQHQRDIAARQLPSASLPPAAPLALPLTDSCI